MLPHTAPAAQGRQPVFFLATAGPAATKAMNTELIAAFGTRHDNPGRAFGGVSPLLLPRDRRAQWNPPRHAQTSPWPGATAR